MARHRKTVPVESTRHQDTRKNIPTEELRDFVAEVANALHILHKPGPWSDDIKASDDFLDPLFERYFDRLGLPDLLRKTDYHVLARLVSRDLIPPEVTARLDTIVTVAQRARPRL